MSVTGLFETPNAQKYLTQLCKHFGHKIPTRIEGNQGWITFEAGEVELFADDTQLKAVLSPASEEGRTRLPTVIDNHLKRFAFREEFEAMSWSE